MALTELQEEIDRSFGDGPTHRPVEARIAAGRRALVRRRVASGVTGLVVAAVGGTAWALAPGDGPAARGDIIATDPTQTPSALPATAQPWDKHTPARYVDGSLEIHPGVVVHEHIENPYDYRAPQLSDALDLTFRGERMWVILERKRSEDLLSTSTVSNGWASFADYVADQTSVGFPDDGGWPATLRLTDQGTVVASKGSEILQRTDDPQLGSTFAGPDTPTGAALVRAAEDGVAYFVVWRFISGKLDVITTPPSDVTGATFQELLSYARAQYSSGEGLR